MGENNTPLDNSKIMYARANGKSFSQTLDYLMRQIYEFYKKMISVYPDKRVVYLATHGSRRTRKKNMKRIIKYYKNYIKKENNI